jgi:phage terminase large subunit-like protein
MQKEVFDDFGTYKQQWIRAGNQSGKSQTCARIVSWVLTATHPNWKKPPEWGDESILVIVAGKTGKQIEDSLLPKIRGYLESGTYKEVRIGNIIQRLELGNGNRVIFQSLEQPNQARERLQSYVAHITWCDELPPTIDLVRELQVRTQARNGYNLWSFTPTVVNTDIQRYVESLKEPDARVYRFNMLDNPLYQDPIRRQELVDRYSYLSEEKRRMIFEGEWLSGDNQVYYFDYNTMVEFPAGYSPLWRHVESVDPASSSKLGYTLWAEHPDTCIWYCIRAQYVEKIYVPTQIIEKVKELSHGVNIVRRICDSHESWYIHQAASMGLNYTGVYKKAGRKLELITKFQELLGSRLRISPSCELLLSELQECRWSDRADGRIINAPSYHLLDSSQYFSDNVPTAEKKIKSNSWEDWLHKANDQRKAKVEKEREHLNRNIGRVTVRKRGSRWN